MNIKQAVVVAVCHALLLFINKALFSLSLRSPGRPIGRRLVSPHQPLLSSCCCCCGGRSVLVGFV